MPKVTNLISITPIVKVSVMVVHDGKMLMGLRDTTYAGAKWCFPSLVLMRNQQFGDCGEQAVVQQAGIEVNTMNVMHTTNDMYRGLNPRHTVTVFLDAEPKVLNDVPVVIAGSSYHEWQWFPLFHPPEELGMSESSFFEEHFMCGDDLDELMDELDIASGKDADKD